MIYEFAILGAHCIVGYTVEGGVLEGECGHRSIGGCYCCEREGGAAGIGSGCGCGCKDQSIYFADCPLSDVIYNQYYCGYYLSSVE